MPGGRILLLLALASSVGLSILLFTTNFIEAGIKYSPIEQVQCDPNVGEVCDEAQTASNGTLSNMTSSISKQAADSDQTRPSDSIKVEGQDEVQVEEQSDNKNVPNPPKIDESTYEVKIYFNTVAFHKQGVFDMYLYVNGKAIKLQQHNIGYPRSNLFYVERIQTFYLNDPPAKWQKNIFQFTFPTGRPLSIMMGGYKLHSQCPKIAYPNDIYNQVLSANGNKDLLLGLQEGLTAEIKEPCNDLEVSQHNPLNLGYWNRPIGYINEVYDPLHFSDEYPNAINTCNKSTGTEGTDFTLCYWIYTKHITLDVEK
jgi:hypothetical protein